MSMEAVLVEIKAMFQHLLSATEIKHENLRYDRRPSGRGLNLGPPKYKMTHLTTAFYPSPHYGVSEEE